MVLSDIISWIIAIIQQHGSLAVFLGVLIEEIIIPIPSPLILMASGFILVDPSSTLFGALFQTFSIILIPAVLAGTIGSFFPYYIGHYARKKGTRWQNYVGIKKYHIRYLEKKMENNAFFYIVLSRMLVIIPMSFVSFVAGFLQLSKTKFVIATFLGSIPRTIILAMLGWYFGNTFIVVAESLSFVENIILLLIIFAIAFFLVKNIRKKINVA